MTVKLSFTDTGVGPELDRLSGLPGTSLALERALAEVFTATLAIVHVVTGSLKNSGKTSSDVHNGEWIGTMEFGGPSPGAIHDPVRYARHEINRGGSHDFLAQAVEFGHRFPAGVEATLAGDR